MVMATLFAESKAFALANRPSFGGFRSVLHLRG
jgi:hypothetical protein